MSILKGVGFQFDESMSGYFCKGETDPSEGAAVGKRQETKIRFDVHIKISDLNRFLKVSQHEAELSGTVTCDAIGGTFTIFEGYDHKNNYSLYQVRGINNDFIGEWHKDLKECNEELQSMGKTLVTNSNFNWICGEHLINPYLVKEDLQANKINLNTLTEDKLTEFILNTY